MQTVRRKNPPVAISRYAVALLAAVTAQSLHAVDVIKENNVDALNLTTSWVGLTAPTSSDVAVWDATVTAANATVLGADTGWSGIRIANPTGAVTINAGNTLTLGTAGIDMSAATQGFTIAAPIVLGASQAWNVGTGTTLTSSGIVSGSATLTKNGAGTLVLVGANTFNGGVALSAGTLSVRNGTGAGAGSISAANGTTFRIERNGTTSIFSGVNVGVAASSTVTQTTDNAANGYSGLISGDAASTYIIGGPTQVSYSLGANTQQFGSFLGTVQIPLGASLRFSSTSGVNNGGSNTTFDIVGNLTTRNTGTINLGKLTGSGTITGSSGANGTATFVIGAKNESSIFSGSINDGGASRFAAVTKTGTGTLTLSGANAYTGGTNVNGGTLFVSGSKSGAGVVTIGASGIVGGTGSISGATTINGGLRPNTAPVNNTSRLTFSTSLTLGGTSTTTFDIDGANYTGVTLTTAESLTFGGGLGITFTNSITPGVYDLFSFTDATPGSFASVSISQGVTSIGGLTTNSGVWTGSYGGFDYTFTEATGDFSVVAVPEPSTWAAIVGVVGLGFAATRRRRSR